MTIQPILDDVKEAIAPPDETLAAARERRDDVLAATKGLPGWSGTYISGSIAHHTANDDTDADSGLVLDRRHYPDATPDGDFAGPRPIVEGVRAYIRVQLQEKYPDIYFRVTKRAIKVLFKQPLANKADPSVDLIVAFRRKAGGLWIPNTERNIWSASDPITHTLLLNGGSVALRRKRRRVIRLAKAWNKDFSSPGLSGFNISALALMYVESGTSEEDALVEFYESGAEDLKKRQTPDPAGVSPPLRTLVDRQTAAHRMELAARDLRQAMEVDDEDEARSILSRLWGKRTKPKEATSASQRLAAALRGNEGVGLRAGKLSPLTSVPAGGAIQLKSTRSYGDGPATQ